jgi:hypothetical protein
VARLPGVQERDALLVEQTFCGEEGEDLMAEELLGCVCVDIGYGMPGSGAVPTAARGDGGGNGGAGALGS